MRKRESDFLLKKAHKLNIKTEELKKDFGEVFLFEILKMLFKRSGCKDSFFLKEEAKKSQISWESFKKEMLIYGVKIESWKENFVDEDTGEVIQIERFSIEALST